MIGEAVYLGCLGRYAEELHQIAAKSGASAKTLWREWEGHFVFTYLIGLRLPDQSLSHELVYWRRSLPQIGESGVAMTPPNRVLQENFLYTDWKGIWQFWKTGQPKYPDGTQILSASLIPKETNLELQIVFLRLLSLGL